MRALLTLITHQVILGVLDFYPGGKGRRQGPLADVNG